MAENIDKRFKDSIVKLQDVIQELETVGQQLQANEQQLRAANQQLTADEQQLSAANQQLLANEQQLQSANHDLGERVKELNCLYGLAKIVEQPNITLPEILRDAAGLLPPAWHYPEITCGRVIYDNDEFKTDNFKETKWSQSADIKISGEKRGAVEVFYLKKRPVIDEGPFLKEERNLIDALAERLSSVIERIQAEEKVKASEQQLRASNQQLSANEQQLRAANQQLAAGQKELERFLKALSAKNKELQSVVYVASHDLRTPLVNIQGFAGELTKSCAELSGLLKGKGAGKSLNRKTALLLDEDIPESLKFINASASMMGRLLDGLLRISRIGSAEIKTETIEMNKFMKNVQRSLEFQIQQSGATVSIKKLPGCYGDVGLLNQVFSNLLDNAIKYLDKKRKGEITISGRVEDNNSIYCVEDNGIGIDHKHQEKVFEIFHRLSPEGQVAGEGLGLSAVWRLLSRLDGTILVESEPGKGSRFLVTLPNSK